jgi:hypothetical protein
MLQILQLVAPPPVAVLLDQPPRLGEGGAVVEDARAPQVLDGRAVAGPCYPSASHG